MLQDAAQPQVRPGGTNFDTLVMPVYTCFGRNHYYRVDNPDESFLVVNIPGQSSIREQKIWGTHSIIGGIEEGSHVLITAEEFEQNYTEVLTRLGLRTL